MFNKINRRLSNEVNAGSMADIAFLLLIFFLVTTTILEDQGITVKLPPWDPNTPVQDVVDHNVLSVKINGANELLVEGAPMPMSDLRAQAKDFIMNPTQRADRPANPRRAVVSLQNDRATEYATYLAVYNELKGAYHELWEQAAQDQFGRNYTEIALAQQKQIRKQIPLVISEAEPTDHLPDAL